jgi:hypothetical protein
MCCPGTTVPEYIRTGYTADDRPVRVMVSIASGDTLILQYTGTDVASESDKTMDPGTAIALAALLLTALTSVIAVWAWRRRRAVYNVELIRKALDDLGDGTGLMTKGLGAFNAKGHAGYRELKDNLAFVTDRRLRKVLSRLLENYETAEAAAMEPSNANMFTMAATMFETDHPANKAKTDITDAIRRLAILQRRASGL